MHVPWRRLGRLTLALLGLTVLTLGILVVHLRRDKTEVFYRVAGTYAGARVLESEAGARSTVRLVELRNERGEAVANAWIRRPRPLPEGYRVAVVYAGAKTGRRILELIPDRPDVVLLSVQYPYRRPETLVERLGTLAEIRRASFRTVAGGLLAVSFLERDEGLDPERLVVIGASLGSAFATLHGALDERVPRVVLVHAGGDFPAVLRAIQRREGRAWLAAPTGWLAEAVADTFDPIHWVGRIAPRELRMIATRRDRHYPVETIEALYARAREPKSILWTDTDHVRSRRDEIFEEIVELIDAYLDASGPPRT